MRTLAIWPLCAALLASVVPTATAGEDLREEVKRLREQVELLESQQATCLEEEIHEYLSSAEAWRGAAGGGEDRITLHASVTGVEQSTIGLSPSNRSVVNGNYDLDFDFQVTDDVGLFVHMTGNGVDAGGSDGSFPSQFGPVVVGTPPQVFGAIAGPTLSGIFDGIGVNGTTPTSPGAATVYEAGFQFSCHVGEQTLHHQMGELDPRTRFLQNALADDAETQFLNDLFNNSAAIEWLTDATGRASFGYYGWLSLGGNREWTVSWGWFNTPGQWFNHGQLYVQVGWRGEVGGREMNIRLLGWLQEFFVDANGDGSSGGGVSFDWWVTEKVGAWVRVAINGGDVTPVASDYAFGVVFRDFLSRRPDDQAGVAIGIISANDNTAFGAVPEDTELTVEVYYKLMLEGGKLQVTPHLMVVTDPGGGLAPWQDDLLFILGVRFHVPF
jgi:hypothetical protein